jgi:hypothetical protein
MINNPPKLKKHVAAVHANTPNYSLTHRKAVNAMLVAARQEVVQKCGDRDDVKNYLRSLRGIEVNHEVTLKDFKTDIDYGSRDHEFLRKVLTDIASTPLQYNIISATGEKEWEVIPILSYAKISRNKVTFRFPSELREDLLNPEVYATIDLAIQNKFISGHALALYENTYRFIKLGKTPFISLAHIKGMLGIDLKAYPEFKYFNREVIKKAVKEINRLSNVIITEVVPKKKGNAISSLQFILDTPKTGDFFEESAASIEESDIESSLYEFGLSKAQIKKLFEKGDYEYLLNCISNLHSEFNKRSDIQNIPAYAWSSLNSMLDNPEPTIKKIGSNVKKKKNAEAAITVDGKISYSEIMERAEGSLIETLKNMCINDLGVNKRSDNLHAIASDGEWENESLLKHFKIFVESTMYIRRDLANQLR